MKWEEQHKRNQDYLRNCCEYPLVIKDKKVELPLEVEKNKEDKMVTATEGEERMAIAKEIATALVEDNGEKVETVLAKNLDKVVTGTEDEDRRGIAKEIATVLVEDNRKKEEAEVATDAEDSQKAEPATEVTESMEVPVERTEAVEVASQRKDASLWQGRKLAP